MCEEECAEHVSTLVLGVGNRMKGDDGVGPYVATRLAAACDDECSSLPSPRVRAIDCGTVPENYTAVVRRVHPNILVIVDAAEMGLGAGECRIIPADSVGVLGLSTHSMPLTLFMSYVRDLASKVVLLGVQPRAMAFGTGLSEEAAAAGEALVSILAQGKVEELAVLD